MAAVHGLMGRSGDSQQVLEFTLVFAHVEQVPVADSSHADDDESAEQQDDQPDGHVSPYHQGIKRQHDQDAQVLVEILHRDGMASPHQDVAAMLQQGVHRHHEEPGHGADQDHQADGRHQVWMGIMSRRQMPMAMPNG
jgi:hypothetical protein